MRTIMPVILLLFVVSQISFVAAEQKDDYGIMIDAGSSGSRIYLYEWPHRDDQTLPLVEPTSINQAIVSLKTNTPLSNFTSNPSSAGESLEPLIAYVKKNLPQNLWSVTPIYLKATAGMRAISVDSQNVIIQDVRAYLKNSGFRFTDDQAKVIPGTDEGIFGWITVNYLLKVLTQINPATTGALDMGGASTQITFQPSSVPLSSQFNATLAGNKYDLYTYSYPLGQDQAGRDLLTGLLQDNNMDANGNVLSPCYLSGYSEPFFNNNSISVLGTGNYDQCKQAVLKYIVKPASNCASCGMTGTYQPALNGKYYAFSGFAYTYQFFQLAITAPISQLRNVGSAFCTSSFSNAKTAYPNTTVPYLKNYCFTATFLSEVLTAYGFSENSTDITVTDRVNGTEVTWALGGMIYEANLLPFGPSDGSSASSVFISFSLFVFSLLAFML